MTASTLISKIFEPIIVMSLAVVVFSVYFSEMTSRQLAGFFVFFFFGLLAPVAWFRMWLSKKKGISWDIPNRADRIVPLGVLSVLFLIAGVILRVWNNAFLNEMFGLWLVWFMGFFLLTFLTKISGHVATSALVAMLWIRLFGVTWWPVLGIVPLVAWARVAGRNHSVGQVLLASAYSISFVLLYDTGKSIFG